MKKYSILTGRGKEDSTITRVMCDESEIRMVATAIYRAAKADYMMPIACVVKEGDVVSCSKFDIMIADCM